MSSSKTNACGMLALAWLMAYYPSRVITMAPSGRQVSTNLWAEIRRNYNRAAALGVPIGGRLYDTPYLKLGDDWYAKGFSTKDPDNVHGFHGENDLIILDDAHGIPKEMTDEVENMMAGGNTRIVMPYNPVVLSGETYDCNHAQRALWAHLKISFWDTPNAKKGGRNIAGMLQLDTVNTWIKKFGRASPFVVSKVDAEYPKQEKDSVVPLGWIELAKLRAAELPEVPKDERRAQTWHGQDVARFGDDDTARCTIVGRKTQSLDIVHGQDTMETAGRLQFAIREQGGVAAVDVIGMGAGVVDRCSEQDVPVMAVNVAEASSEIDEAGKVKFANLRAELWWRAREALDPDNADALSLPEDDMLAGELASVRYKINSQGRIQVESKEEMKKRLGHSPDRGDAFCLAVYARLQGAGAGNLINIL